MHHLHFDEPIFTAVSVLCSAFIAHFFTHTIQDVVVRTHHFQINFKKSENWTAALSPAFGKKKALCIVPGPQWGPLGIWKDVSIGAIHFFKSEHASLQRVGKTWSSRSLLILMEAWSNCAIINSCLQAWSWSYMRGESPLGECHKVGRHTSCRRLKSGRS